MTVGQDITSTTEGCRYCWMCRQACPVGHVTRRETLTPHGWGMVIASERRGVVSWTPEVVDVLYSCADCGLCQAHCATGQPLPDAIAAARAASVAAGAAPSTVTELHERLVRWGNPFAQGAPASAVPATGEVGLFVGDHGLQSGGDVVLAAVQQLLDASGVQTVAIGAGRSNGHLASALGYPATAAAHGQAIIDEVVAAGCREVLVLTPGDRFAFERLYGERLGLSWPSEVTVREVTTVLAEALAEGRLRLRASDDARPYAYLDPCHTARIARDHVSPRVLLQAVAGPAPACRLFWREERAHPCGASGGLEYTQPAIAASLAAARFADAIEAGATRVITEDPAGLRHLRAHGPDGVAVQGLYELLAAGVQA